MGWGCRGWRAGLDSPGVAIAYLVFAQGQGKAVIQAQVVDVGKGQQGEQQVADLAGQIHIDPPRTQAFQPLQGRRHLAQFLGQPRQDLKPVPVTPMRPNPGIHHPL